MTKRKIRVLIGALLTGVTCAAAGAMVAAYQTTSPFRYAWVDYANAGRLAGSEYRAARAGCEAFGHGQRAVCIGQAHAAERRARAEAEERFRGTSKSGLGARIETAKSD